MISRGKKIQTIRNLRDLSQEQLAQMADLSARSISLAENDHNVGHRVISKIELALAIELDSPDLDDAFLRLLGEQPSQPTDNHITHNANVKDRELNLSLSF